MASPSDITIDASTQSEKLHMDVIQALTQLLKEKRQAKAKEEELDTRLQSNESHLQSTRGKREAVAEQMKELEKLRRQLIVEEGLCVLKSQDLWMEKTEAKEIQDDIFKQMLQVQKLCDNFQLDGCEEAKSLFRESVEDGDEAVVRLLVTAAAINDDGWIPLITASSRGDVETVKKLLFAGAGADSKDIIFGRTALSWASGGGHKAIARLLLDRAVNVNLTDNDGWTPMHWASEKGHEDVVRLLLDRGAKIGCRKTLCGQSRSISELVFSPDSKFIASGSHEGIIEIWDTATGQCQQSLQHQARPITPPRPGMPQQAIVESRSVICSIVFTHDSILVISGSNDGSIRVWDRATGDCKQILQGHKRMVQSLAISHDSRLIVSGSNDMTMKIWDFATGKCQRTMPDHSFIVYRVAFSHDSKLIASGSFDGQIRIWSSATGECLQTLTGWREQEIFTLAFSHDPNRIVSGLNHDIIKIWDVTTGQCQLQMRCRDDDVGLVTFSPTSEFVVSTSRKNTIYIWDSTTGKCLRKLQAPDNTRGVIAFSKDFKFIASPSISKGLRSVETVKLWDNFVLSCVICPSGKLVERGK